LLCKKYQTPYLINIGGLRKTFSLITLILAAYLINIGRSKKNFQPRHLNFGALSDQYGRLRKRGCSFETASMYSYVQFCLSAGQAGKGFYQFRFRIRTAILRLAK
jgi:hypothetical protein